MATKSKGGKQQQKALKKTSTSATPNVSTGSPNKPSPKRGLPRVRTTPLSPAQIRNKKAKGYPDNSRDFASVDPVQAGETRTANAGKDEAVQPGETHTTNAGKDEAVLSKLHTEVVPAQHNTRHKCQKVSQGYTRSAPS